MRILYVTTVGSTMYFFQGLIRQLLDEGHTVDIACNDGIKPVLPCYREWGCRVFTISCTRSPFSPSNIKAVKQIKKIVAEGGYDIVHCHTPIASACARLACRKFRREGLRVVYTSHGFHFYKGAPLKNWIVYYPVEKICSRFTDTLITINEEDYLLSKEKLSVAEVERIPGVGVDLERFRVSLPDRSKKRSELGVPEDAFLLISVGELNENKNHKVVIRALSQLNDPRIHYMIAGKGGLSGYLKDLSIELGVSRQVHLLGFREDVPELYAVSDVVVFPSVREGLGLVSVEGMASGLPLICADNRGTREYSAPFREDGLVCPANDASAFAAAIKSLADDPEKCRRLGDEGKKTAAEFSVDKVISIMKRIYFG